MVEVLADKAQEEGCSFFARGEVVLTEEIPADCVGEIFGIDGGGEDRRELRGRPQRAPADSSGKQEQPAPSFGRRPRFSTR